MRNRYDIAKSIKSELKNPANTMEGSFAADNAQAVAGEIEKTEQYAEYLHEMQFIDTAVGEYLDRGVIDIGLERKRAKASKGELMLQGNVGVVIAKGALFHSDTLSFKALESVMLQDGDNKVLVECTQAGALGNVGANVITKSDVEGITSIKHEAFKNGYNEETDGEFRERIYLKIRTPATSGNVHHYKNWALEVEGVGKAKVFPLHAGNGTVKVSILNSNFDTADSELINKVKNYIAPSDRGDGMAPIGANLTVTTAAEKTINVSVQVETAQSDLEGLKTLIQKRINEYFKSIAYEGKAVSYAKIGDIIIDTVGVSDYQNLTVNGSNQNIAIAEEEIAKLGTLEVTR